jgi:hypothetical protein
MVSIAFCRAQFSTRPGDRARKLAALAFQARDLRRNVRTRRLCPTQLYQPLLDRLKLQCVGAHVISKLVAPGAQGGGGMPELCQVRHGVLRE